MSRQEDGTHCHMQTWPENTHQPLWPCMVFQVFPGLIRINKALGYIRAELIAFFCESYLSAMGTEKT